MTEPLKVEPPELEGYRYESHLGSGGYSEVFLYRDLSLGREVAVKVLTEGGSEDEARAMAAVSSHTYIVDIYRTDVTDDGLPYLVMQYYPRPTYAQRVKRGPLSVAEVLKLGVELSGALEHAHQAGVLHRDIKPANILSSASNRPGLADFGIASHAGAPRDQVSMSLPWVPPEVLEGRIADERGDIYSLAATLFTLLEGRAPFVQGAGDDGDEAVVRRTLGQEPPRVTTSVVPESLNALLRTALAKRPEDRPARAETFGRALQAVEAELKLNRTPLEVPTVHDDEAAEDMDDDLDATRTRARSVRVVVPVDVDDATRPRNGLDGGLIDRVPARPAPVRSAARPSRSRLTVPEPPPLEDTRSRVPGPAESAQANDGRSGGKVVKVVGAMVAVVLVAAFAINGLSGRSSGGVPPSTGPDNTTTSPTIETAVARVKDLAIVRTGGQTVRVSWSYPGFAKGDRFHWQRCDLGSDPTVRSTTATQIVLTDAPSGVYPCVGVRVQLADGRESDVEQQVLK